MSILKDIFSNPWKNTNIRRDFDLENLSILIAETEKRIISIQNEYHAWSLMWLTKSNEQNREEIRLNREKYKSEYEKVIKDLIPKLQNYINILKNKKISI